MRIFRVFRRSAGSLAGSVGALLLALLPACGADPGLAPEPPCQAVRLGAVPRDANLVLVVNDTMRRDRPGVYGGPARTPVFDAFARDHLVFLRSFSEAPWTLPAMATLFTSLHPSQHGVTSHPHGQSRAHGPLHRGLRTSDVLDDAYQTLPEVLRDAGFRTAAFVSNPWLDSRFGFAQGFEEYQDRFALFGVPGVAVARAALRWLKGQDPEERFFLYVHTIDSHRPYGVLDWKETLARADELRRDPRTLTPEQREELAPLVRFSEDGKLRGHLIEVSAALVEMAYDAGVEQFDAALGLLLEGLRKHPAWERTAVVVTSDHGEALYERGYGNHGNSLFDEELAVPLAARLPGASAAGPVDCAVGLIDLMPTLCAYLDLPCPARAAGTSFLPGPERAPRYLVSEAVMGSPGQRALRTRAWKLLSASGPGGGAWGLYDLRADPGETRNLLEGEPSAEARRIAAFLGDRLAEAVPASDVLPRPRSAPLDPDLERRLRELGYLDGDD